MHFPRHFPTLFRPSYAVSVALRRVRSQAGRQARHFCGALLFILACPSGAHAQPETLPVEIDSSEAATSLDDPVRYVLDDVQVRGNDKTSSRVVLRYVPFAPGDVLDVDDPNVVLTKYRLLGTGFFRDVVLSLEKGKERGHVVLVIIVVERNTIVVNDLWMGLAASADTNGQEPQLLSPFAGVDAAETNLLGTGISLGSATAFSKDQLGLAVRFLDPALAGGRWMLSGDVLYNDALGFFGNDGVRWEDPNQISEVPRQAVVDYRRLGARVGLGLDLTVSSQLWANYRLESVDAMLPRAAAHLYGGELEPIDFRILPGRSILSTLGAAFYHDTRDQPILTTSGTRASFGAEVSLRPTGSDYSYQRFDLGYSRWWPLAHGHTIKLEAFAGAIAGNAPFFEQYYIGDLSDFRPGRILGLAFDDRPAPNFLGTSIAEIRYGDYAARLTSEYRIPLYRGYRSIYGIDFYFGAGAITLAGLRDIERPPADLSGARLIPIDLTGNLGFQMDTSLGGVTFSFANALGFIPFGGER
jgi:outer membrane protein insertion porin family